MNRLKNEKSPYLLQHKDNPVDWYPWGDEAFEAAKRENRPVFLSIGYSTCYWCHMMEKDSFEIQEVADLLNRDFISVKVDREEHPDVDKIYMDAVVCMTGQGGWPMSVFLTPDLKPFYGGTFFWKEQFLQLLANIRHAWKTEPQKIFHSSQEFARILQTNVIARPKAESISLALLENASKKAFEQWSENFDSQYGGFGGAPKFPHGIALSALLCIHRRTGNPEAMAMVNQTLDAMAEGAIYDAVGGGFHRYATHADWSEPHYEKMLYDNALLSRTYLEAFEITRNPRYAKVARETLDYILREMTDPEGGFYSAEDAGEVGKEGAFYRLSREERAKSPRPRKDDKILTSWNGLMIAALAVGYLALKDPRYLEAAKKSARFVQTELFQKGEILRRYRDGESRFSGTLDDYAFLIHGLLNLFEADCDPLWLEWARELQKKQDQIFWDAKEGGYYFSNPDDPALYLTKKEYHDGATPSGNAVAALNLVKLHQWTGDKTYGERGRELLERIAAAAEQNPSAHAECLIALSAFFNPPAATPPAAPACKIPQGGSKA